MTKKILLIEDNKEISKNIAEYLELENYEVLRVFDGESGLTQALQRDFDCVLLDIGLPKLNGFLVCEKILQKKSVPIIFITSREFIEDRIFGLKSGAYDYIVKPFDLRELELRIAIALKKSGEKPSDLFEKNGICIDFSARSFTKENQTTPLTQKEIDILKILIQKSPNFVERTTIIEAVW